jgi:WD40 repeat protein
MNPENRFPINLDSVAGLVTGFFLLSITVVVVLGNQIGIRVTADSPTVVAISPYETLTLKFSEPVDGSLAINKFSVQPAISGNFKWNDTKTLQFTPREPFKPDTTYKVTLAPGVLTPDGHLLKKAKSWDFQTRSPLVAYLAIESGKSRLWTVDPESGKTNPLTDDSLNIADFDTAANGEFIVISAFNDQQGIDLWRIERAGGSPLLLLQCGADRCSVPAISPDSRRVAYVREAAAPGPDLAFGSPRIHILDLENKQDAPLYEDQQIIGYDPVWSPDGTYLSSYDGIKDEIRLLDLITSEQMIIPSQTGNPVTWSADGSTFVYTDVDTNEFGSHTRVREAKLITKEIVTLFGDKDERDYHYNSLAWSPVEDSLAIGLRPDDSDPSEALWLMSPVSLDGRAITDQPDYAYSTPLWDPWGSAVIFQQFKLKGPYKPEIGIWTKDIEQPQILANGIMPHWLP